MFGVSRCGLTCCVTSEMDIAENIATTLNKIKAASSARHGDGGDSVPVRLVAVSKTKPVSAIIEAYQAGQREFGENYTNELIEKASDTQILELCPDICWHFIGTLQRNKASRLARLPNLSVVETVDSVRLADTLNGVRERAGLQPLQVMVQVNTSGESNKGGVAETDLCPLIRHITDNCTCLKLLGLMTIGAYNRDISLGPNPDFQALLKCRDTVCTQFDWSSTQLELSMGMSTDFEHAISLGSTNVRVGSGIFGAREPKTSKTEDSSSKPVSE